MLARAEVCQPPYEARRSRLKISAFEKRAREIFSILKERYAAPEREIIEEPKSPAHHSRMENRNPNKSHSARWNAAQLRPSEQAASLRREIQRLKSQSLWR